MNIIANAIAGEVVPTAFLLKIIFTAITLGCGFKGGEIVPTLFVGATFGCIFGQLTRIFSIAGRCLWYGFHILRCDQLSNQQSVPQF